MSLKELMYAGAIDALTALQKAPACEKELHHLTQAIDQVVSARASSVAPPPEPHKPTARVIRINSNPRFRWKHEDRTV